MKALRPAEQLIQLLGIVDPRDIDLEAIAFDQGAQIRYRELNDCEARIVGCGERAIITVDNRRRPTRVRFSAAHELGHWCHHRGRAIFCRTDDIGNPRRSADRERVADSYAADLLLPRQLFVPRATSLGKTTFENIEQLSQEFSTSLTATAIRAVDHGAEAAMLVCHGQNGRQWFHRPSRIPQRWFPAQELDSDSNALDVLFGSDRRSHRSRVAADTWFDRRESSDFEIVEQSFKISDNEVLTILVFVNEEMLEDR